MKNNDAYYDRLATKLYKKYSKDDLIRHYKNRLSKTMLEHGKDSAYIDELEHEIAQVKARMEVLQSKNEELQQMKRDTLKDIKREELYKQLLKHNKKLVEHNKALQRRNDELIYKLTQKQNAD
jgi:chromosome segregation ATPase